MAVAATTTGAGVSLVRNVVYFDGATITEPLMVLGGWALFGLALELAAQARTRLSLARRLEPSPVPRLTPELIHPFVP
ncbi:MAG TPA: hypothetical protein VFP78_02160 [Solirubrobacteraceae bacterium]|nr:hypothetical protein [Solirubrobacteraceae bacterium]